MRIITTFLVVVMALLSVAVYGQANNNSDLWTSVEESSIPKAGKRYIVPQKYQTLKLDVEQLKKTLAKAPLTKTAAVKTNPCYLDIPWPDGTIKKFQITESPIMEKGLALQFPEIKTYAGAEVGNWSNYIRLDLTPQGFHAMILTATEGTVYIDPYTHGGGDIQHYISYNRKDYTNPAKRIVCDVQGNPVDVNEFKPNAATSRFGSCELRVYRLAVAATGEYTAFHGGSVAQAQAAQVTTINRVNAIYIRDMAIQFNLVANNNLLVYTNAGSDPYTNGTAGSMIGENQTNIDAVIGSGNYDVGHVFGTNSGGLAGLGVICFTGQKARGVTGGPAPIGDPFDIDYVCHEVGHQFGANHTQNNNCNRNGATAMEPGSGSTIMAYAGICAPNVQGNSDAYFHGISLQEISNRILSTSCPVTTALSNGAPSISSTNGAGVTIPANTPFKLTAVASDPNPTNTLTYCWEQMDNQVATMPPVAGSTGGPSFRSYNPAIDPTRYFPNLGDILAGTTPTWEVLPSATRTMNFRVTVRDNAPGGGCSDHEDVTVNIDGNSGPFVVSYPSATGISWGGLTTETVTWSVAGTDVAPVACANVDILLSTNGGFTYPTVLASNVPNDGSQLVTVPNTATNSARIMVVCSNGTFFDVSNNNFTITAAVADYSLATTPDTVVVCQPSNGVYTVNVGQIGSYTNAVNLSVSGTPAGASAAFSPSSVIPGNNSTLTISNTGAVAAGTYNLTVTGNSTSGTKTNDIVLVINTPPSGAILTSPTNGAAAISTSTPLTWTGGGSPSEVYEIDIATDAGFTAIVDNATGLTTSTYVSGALNSNTTYYWRVRVSNACGTATYSSTFSFTTNSCSVYTSTDIPVNITTSGTPTITSTLNIPATGLITDVNVVNLAGTHTYVSDLTVSLASPATTSVELFSGICTSDDDFDLNFDDAGAATIPCPPTSGLTYQPTNPLSVFNNENPSGVWTLTIADGFNQDGGDLLTWGLEVCVTAPASDDAGISAIVLPPDGFAICDNPVTPEVTITNYGASTLTTATINYNIDGGANNTFNWTGSLGTGASANVILNPITAPTPNVFTFTAYTTVPNGTVDANVANDTSSALSQIISATALPYSEPFEGGAMPANLLIAENPVGGPLWVHNNALSAYGVGTGSMNLDNYNTDTRNSIDLAYLPWLDFSSQSGVELTFDVAYAKFDATFNDTLAIYASNDCGTTYNLVYRKGGDDLATAPDNGNAFTPTTAEWRNDTVDLSAYDNSSHVRLIFVNEGGYGNIVHVDNINVAASSPCNLTASVSSQTNVACRNTSTGAVTFAAANGTPAYTYDIGTGSQSSPTFSGLVAGSYTVTVTDAGGCTANTTVNITQPAAVLAATATSTNVSCNGANDGTATIAATGGTANYTYNIGAGNQSSNLFTGLSASLYTVTVTDANGCMTTTTTNITQPTALAVAVSGSTNPNCNNGSDGTVTLAGTGGTPAYTYNIGTGAQSSPVFTGLNASSYTATITDNNGCTAVAPTVTLTNPTTVNATAAITSAISCAGGNDGAATATAIGGTGSYTYAWSNGATTATISNLAANTYTVSTTDGNGCIDTDNITLTNPTGMSSSASVSANISCFGATDGAVSSTVSGGAGSYTYSWNTGASNASVTGLGQGTYVVTITDNNGCTTVSSASLTQPTLLSYSNSSTNVSCNGGNNGTATITLTGGTPTYTYAWSDGQSTTTATGLAANTYTVTATDANGCSVSSTAIVNQPTALAITVTGTTNVSCNGGNDGSITVAATGGSGGYTYSLGATSQATTTFSGLTATSHTISVTDINGCTSTTTATLTQPSSAVAVSISAFNNVSCNGGNNGAITATATGGTGAYTYNIGTGSQTSSVFTTLPASSYTITATDANGCMAMASQTLTDGTAMGGSTAITSNYNGADISCFGAADGALTNTTVGGTGSYTYLWSDGQTVNPAVGLGAGSYDVTITDGNGCTTVSSASLSNPTALSSSIADNGDGTATATGTGGTGAYTYSWSNGATTATATGLVHNSMYTVTITDANGCTSTATVTVNITGLGDIPNLSAFDIIPNPNAGDFQIQIMFATTKDATVRITNVLGQILREYNFSDQNITIPVDIQEQASGIYFVVLNTGNKSITRKVTITK